MTFPFSGIVSLTEDEIVAIQAEPSPGNKNATEAIPPGENVTEPLSDGNTISTASEQIQQSLSFCYDGNPPYSFLLDSVPMVYLHLLETFQLLLGTS